MPARGEFLRADLEALAAKAAIVRRACTSEESTKLYLVLPLLGVLGYSDPDEVSLEHPADFSGDGRRVDVAIILDGAPTIAVECKKVGAELDGSRNQLAGYFNALKTVRLGILTDGMRYEFFVDSDEPNFMDEEPFLVLNLSQIAEHGPADEVLDALQLLRKERFDPGTIAAAAHAALVRKRLRMVLLDEARSPSLEFCRLVLDKIGVSKKRQSTIERVYGPIVKAAFEESLIIPVIEQLDVRKAAKAGNTVSESSPDNRVITTNRELALIKQVHHRLAFLAEDERQFDAIEHVGYKDYIGKLVVYVYGERKGWLFDYIEGADGLDTFIFPDPFGEIVTNDLRTIDKALKTTFAERLRQVRPLVQVSRRRAAG